MADLSYAQVSALLKYDSETGKLYWLQRPVEMFSSAYLSASWNARKWNTRYADKEAFTALDGKGYHYGQIFKTPHRAHRVGWLLHYGAWPENHIDHINGIKTDNRIENLRDVTQTVNGKNKCLRSDNSSGIPGVSWMPKKNQWRARIMEYRKETHLGYFDNFDDAIKARKEAEKALGFHPNHGRTALEHPPQ